jgi:hypothetical protein
VAAVCYNNSLLRFRIVVVSGSMLAGSLQPGSIFQKVRPSTQMDRLSIAATKARLAALADVIASRSTAYYSSLINAPKRDDYNY